MRAWIFVPMFLGAVGIFAFNAWRLFQFLRLARPENRWDRVGQRLWQTLVVAFGQSRILRDRVAGPIHAGIFWGFLVLLSSAVEAVLEGFNPRWSLSFLGPLYSVSTIAVDLFCAIVFVAVLWAAWRRWVQRVARLQGPAEEQRDAVIVLGLIAVIVTALLLQNSTRIALQADHAWAVRPVSTLLAQLFAPNQTTRILFEVGWWVHIGFILIFLNYLPFSKHLHVLTSVPNVFFARLGPVNVLDPLDFAREDATVFGATDVEHLSWKSILDSYSCTHCGRCTSVCPANQTGKILDPRAIVVAVRQRTLDRMPLLLKQRRGGQLSPEEEALLNKRFVGDYIPEEALWQCTTCGACMEECPVLIEHVPVIVELRRGLVMMEARFPTELQSAYGNLEIQATPWAFAASDRAAWAAGLPVKTLAEESTTYDVLFWVGCAGSYDQRAQRVARSIVQLLTAAGVQVRILGAEERCTGDPARRTGNEYLADGLVRANVETLNRYGVRTIVTMCPHCYNTLKNEYPRFGGFYQVYHHTQYLRRLLEEGRLQLTGEHVQTLLHTVVYHDSCYLGRYNGEYEAPRVLLEVLPTVQLSEPERARDRGFCCGAGGGRMFLEERVGKKVNLERTEELLATGAETIAVNCPFCLTMLTDGVKALGKADTVRVRDVAEILAEHLPAGDPPAEGGLPA
ncbi:Lactate utilization protein A [bacterium HR21]|nr:Lactate utilization protein A [bacterium HR21]